MNETWLNKVKWSEDGLVPAIAQDAETGRVLMVAWMNREALQLTAAKSEAVYWSRSRSKIWHKAKSPATSRRLGKSGSIATAM